MLFPIQEMMLTPNRWSRPQTKLKDVKGVVIHWTANENSGADAVANRNFFENRKYGRTGFGSAHFFVDDQQIIQCLPEDERAYHVGATKYRTTRFGSYPNNCTLGIEMCVNSDGQFSVVYKQTVLLAAKLIKKYNLDPDLDLVRHYDVTGKNCPAMFTSNHWGRINNSYAKKYGVGSNADRAWKVFKQAVKDALVAKSDRLIGLPTIRKGTSDRQATIVLQNSLNKLGFNAGVVDGVFGPGTEKAVKDFQSSKGLVADGIVGPMTWNMLDRELNKAQQSKPVEEVKQVLKDIVDHWAKGDIEKLVKLGIVNGRSDGTFAPNETITRAETAVLLSRTLEYIERKYGE